MTEAEDRTRPTVELAGVEVAFGMLTEATTGMSGAGARGDSRLPGWSRGHVLTHIARNADGQRRMVEGAIRDEVVEQYPGGTEQRAADIEAGADRPITVLLADVRTSQQSLVEAWDRLPDDGWHRLTSARAEIRPVRKGVMSRWRELLVHLVDLDVGVTPGQLPADYRAVDADWLAEHRTTETWPDAPW